MILSRVVRVLCFTIIVALSSVPTSADPMCPFQCRAQPDAVSERCLEYLVTESQMSDCLELKHCDGFGNCVWSCSGRICMWA
jgi:hypothetical protein